MSIVTADWLPYRLSFRRPWRTATAVLECRSGRLLRLTADDGRSGWGDCAPLPEFGIGEDTAQAFAEECAYLDLAAQAAGLPLNAWLSDRPACESIAVNAALGAICEVSPAMLAEAAGTGYTVVKLKAGVDRVAEEIAALQRLAASAGSRLRFRLDANGAWDFADAAAFIAGCAGLPVEGLEEPLHAPERQALARLQQLAAFPLAIDESLPLLEADFFRHPCVRRLALKPARHGGLLAAMELALRARAVGIEVVVTSALESACGLLACAQLAAAVAPEGIHGLATGDCFSEDTGVPPSIVGVRLRLPAGNGIGFLAAG